MKRMARLKYLLVGLVALVVVPLSVAEVSARMARRKAERLLHDIRQLQVGKSTFEAARAFIAAHGGSVAPGCTSAHCSLKARVESYPPLMNVWGRFSGAETEDRLLRALRYVGLQYWFVRCDVTVGGEIVTEAESTILVLARGGWALEREMVDAETIPGYVPGEPDLPAYSVNWMFFSQSLGEGLRSRLTPAANAEQRSRAYDFNFDCLTTLGGCASLCKLAPAAFADEAKLLDRLPYLEENDPQCVRFKPPATTPNQTPK